MCAVDANAARSQLADQVSLPGKGQERDVVPERVEAKQE